MVLRRPAAFAILAITAMLFALLTAACGGGEPVAASECFIAKDGRIVAASGDDCAIPPDATPEPTPTFTPIPTGGGGVSGGAGLLILNGCGTCHTLASVPAMKQSVGPDLTGVGTKGADFIRESILNPSAVLTEGYEDGLMPQDFATSISPADLDAIVNYLATQ